MSVIPQSPRASRGLRPLGPLPGFCLGPAGDAVTRPLVYSRPPLTTNPGSAPANHRYFSTGPYGASDCPSPLFSTVIFFSCTQHFATKLADTMSETRYG